MSTCILVDTSDWLGAGCVSIGDAGGGVLGSAIASSGTDGPGYAYNDLALPADAGKEICGRITAWPSFGTLTSYEDTGFTYTRVGVGADSFQYQLYVDVVPVGAPTTVTLNVGSSINLAGANCSQGASSGTGSASVVPAGPGTVNLVGSNSAQTAGSGTGFATIIPAPGVVNLGGLSASQSANSDGAAVTVIPLVHGVVNLLGSDCVQSGSTSAGVITISTYTRAPVGDGFRPRHTISPDRPAATQGAER